ncbi:MAG: LysR family transcriptional regulator [Solimonas sp.]
MDLRHLKHFRGLAQHGHFGRAAKALHLTQPALTRSIQMLESQLGVTLIERDNKRFELTQFGRLVLERAELVLRETERLKRDVELMRGMSIGELRVGASPIPADTIVGPALAWLIEQRAGLQVEFLIRPWQELSRSLRKGDIELFVGETRGLNGAQDLEITALPPYAVGFVARADHPLARRERVAFKDISHYPLALSRNLPPSITQTLGRAMPERYDGEMLRVEILYDTFAAAKTIMQHSDTIFLTPLLAVRADLASELLAVLPVTNFEMSANFALVTLRGHALTPAAAALRQWIVERETSLGGA